MVVEITGALDPPRLFPLRSRALVSIAVAYYMYTYERVAGSNLFNHNRDKDVFLPRSD